MGLRYINTSNLSDDDIEYLITWPPVLYHLTLLQTLLRVRNLGDCKSQAATLNMLSDLLESNPGLGHYTMFQIIDSILNKVPVSI